MGFPNQWLFKSPGAATGTIPTVTSWANYTPTFTGFGTVSTHSIWWRRVGDTVHIRGKFTTGTTTETEARITLPSVNSDATKVPAIQYAGSLVYDGNAAALTTTLIESNVSYMTFGLQQAGSAGLTKINGSTVAGAGVVISILFECPISGW